MRQIDWDKIKTEYVTGSASLRDLAKKHDVTYGQLGNHSRREGWVELRKKHRAKVVSRAEQKITRAQVDELAEGWRQVSLLDKVVVALLESLIGGETELITKNGQPGREIESISKALMNSDELKRRLKGVMSPRDEARTQIERERWEHEKKRDEDQSRNDKTVHVVFEKEIEEYSE